ncbi:hypothetical protein FOA52_008111 [Chlamydomonas sp. UWO 241]|nr:hypothetical protein FOA52_008111 [Chlamydomonas sp. UWO 241]
MTALSARSESSTHGDAAEAMQLSGIGVPRRRAQQHMNIPALAWCAACALCAGLCVPRMEDAAVDLAIVYFQPLLPPLLMLWLWAHNTGCFEDAKLPFEECFALKDRRYVISSGDIQKLATAFTVVFATWAALFGAACATRSYALAEYVPLLLYISTAVLLTLPVAVLARPTRAFFLHTVQRVLLPVRAVSWADFLLADMLTSLAKSTGDLARAACFLGTGPSMQHLVSPAFGGPPEVCGPLAPLAMASVCAPYVIRFVQCLLVFRATRNAAQLFNAAKYVSALPALLLTIIEHESHIHSRPFPKFWVWVCATSFNTAFSFYWDTEQDWDMPWLAAAFTSTGGGSGGSAGSTPGIIPTSIKGHPGSSSHALRRWLPLLRPNAVYAPPWYVWACASNLALRLSWTYRLVGHGRHAIEASAVAALVVGMLEVFRRYQWAFIRVETELRKLKLLPHAHTSHGYTIAAAADRELMGVHQPPPAAAAAAGAGAQSVGVWAGSAVVLS